MTAIDHVSERADALARLIIEPYRPHHFAIDRGDLLALAQVGDGCRALFLRNPERDAAAGAAAVEAEHEAGLFRRPPGHKGINAERAVLADQPRRNPLEKFEARPPHQRTIAEHPQV